MRTTTEHLAYFRQLGLKRQVVDELLEITQAAPARDVAKRALGNFKCDFSSRLNGRAVQLESRSCEMLFALTCELRKDVYAYWAQPLVKNVERDKRISSLTADFLVFEHREIVLVECKPEARLVELAAAKPAEWVRQDGTWNRPPLDRWAEQRGLTHRIWSPPQPYVNYLANLELLYDRLCRSEVPPIPSIKRLSNRLSNEPLSLDQAQEIRGVTLANILWALANGQVHGTLRSVSLANTAHFRLFASNEQAMEVDDLQLQELHLSFQQPDKLSRLLLASPTDYSKGRERLARVMRILNGHEPRRGKIIKHVRAVEKALSEGASPLAACLTNYANCGRRVPQLVRAQEEELERQVRAYRSGASKTKRQAFSELRARCEARSIRPPAYSTLLDRLKGVCPSARALRTAGRRAYHAERPAIDPQFRSQPAAAFGLTVHVDSTKFDARCIASFRGEETKEAPTLYVAVDQATGLPLGRALVFGAARREALAILIRDILHRNGFLPKYWLTDGGAEYTSHWFLGFAEAVGICRLQPPPGAPKHNSLIENLLGRINQQVAHHLIGSTAPDKQGRRVDAPFKSYRQARLQFCDFVRQIDAALFEDFAASPLRLKPGTPEQHRRELVEEFGQSGISIPYDDSFLIMTSLPIDRDCKLDPRRGIRHQGRIYSSAKLLECAAHEEALEKRRDCVDPSRMYVKFKRGWVTAFSEDSVKLQASSNEERLFESLCRAELEASGRRKKVAVEANRFDRLKQANAAAAATTHLRGRDGIQEAPKIEKMPWLPDDASLDDFDSGLTP